MSAQAELLRLRVNSLAAEVEFTAALYALQRAAAGTTDDVVGLMDFTLEGKSVSQDAAGAVHVEGYAAGFERDRVNDIFEPGALVKGLAGYMKNPVLLWSHDFDKPLGVVEDARVDGKGLFIRARLDPPEPGTQAADLVRRVKLGSLKGFSVGGYWRRRPSADGGSLIHDCDLVEISICAAPVQPGSLFTVAGKAVGSESVAARRQKLRELGALVDLLSETAGKL